MSEVKDNNWLDKIKDLLGDTPKDKKDLITLLDTAAKNSFHSRHISNDFRCLQCIRNSGPGNNDPAPSYDNDKCK